MNPLAPSLPTLAPAWNAARRGLHLLSWLVVLGLNLPVYRAPGIAYPWLHDAVGVGLAAAVYYAQTEWLVPRYYERGRWLAFGLLAGLGLGLAQGALLATEHFLLHDEALRAFPTVQRFRVYALVLLAVATGMGFFQQTLRHRRMAEASALARLAQQQESQLLYLRSQINPHFLFNTLNNIYALALTGSAQTAETVLRLANLLRYAIYSTRQKQVRVADEVAQIEELLALFRLRSAEPPALSLFLDPAAAAVLLEPMLLIPLVENCLKHADLDTNPRAFVRLTAQRKGNYLVFETENTTDPADRAKDHTPGVGLDNIRRRLALTYPAGEAELHTEYQAGRFVARLRLPG